MTDALSVAQAAQLEARAAMTEISAHQRDCVRRGLEVQREIGEVKAAVSALDCKIDAILEQLAVARGVATARSAFFGGIPNAFWDITVKLIMMAVVAGLAVLWSRGKLWGT